MKTYVVAADRPSALLTRRILDRAKLAEVVVANGGPGQTNALNTARSVQYDQRGAPVAVVLNARTSDPEFVREQEEDHYEFLHMGVRTGVIRLFMAVPELETVLFSEPATLERILERSIPADALFEAQFRPRVVLQRLLDETHPGCDLAWVAERIDAEAGCVYAQHPLICSLIEFLRHPSAWSPHAAAA
jgi:hypothetical protein